MNIRCWTGRLLGAFLALVVFTAAGREAQATFHTFIISEVFSSADGQVQFIELKENLGFAGQNLWAGHTLTAENADGTQSHQITFPSNLPSTATASKRVLVATANFSSLPGGVTPDYIIPANFLFTNGRVNFAGLTAGADVTYSNLPTNGTQSLNFPGGTTALNSPSNFAGVSGQVNVPSGSCCNGGTCALATSFTCTGTFTALGSCSPNPCAAATGACCNGTVCTVATQSACAGAYKGDGVACGTTGNPVACCPANFNGVGGVTVQDIFDFLSAYFGGAASADFNHASGVSVQDIFDFLGAYFAGCA